jgi:hypothetical protein
MALPRVSWCGAEANSGLGWSYLRSGTEGSCRPGSACATRRRGRATGLAWRARSSLPAVEEGRCGDGRLRRHEDALG